MNKPKSSEGKGIKKILSLVNGKWVKWNGKDDCKCLLIKENITLDDYKKYYKSLDKNKPKQLEWEKEFKYYCNKEQTEILVHPLEIKSFIKNLLTQQRKELLEEILNLECLKEEKLIDDTKVDCMILEKTWEDNDLKVIRNQLRNEIIDEIKKL